MKTKMNFLNIPISRIIALFIMDIMSILVASFMALFIRFEFRFSDIPLEFWKSYIDLRDY